MSIIQKMLLILLAIALLPAFLVSSIFYLDAKASLEDRELNQLEAIATIQQTRVANLIDQNNALLSSYTARAGLRTIIDRYNQLGHKADRELLQQSVAAIKEGNKSLKMVSILSPAGTVVASTRTDNIGRNYAGTTIFATGRAHNDVTTNISRSADGALSMDLVGPFNEGSRVIGLVVMESDMRSFRDLTADYTGLGMTGETIIAMRNADKDAVYLLPLRFDKQAALRRTVSRSNEHDPIIRALEGHEGSFMGTVDYHGQRVLAATRYIPKADWGLAVKIDEAEAFQPLRQLGNTLLIVMFILSVAIIFIAFYLARRLNEPILTLAVTADKIRSGDLSARARISTQDEIGHLTETFNAMADNVEKVDQMKSEFVLLTSHQLRTPATAVKGFISMLLDGYAGRITPKQKALVDAAYTENERQISVINSILDVARMEAGEMVLARAMHDVGQILQASADGQEPLLRSHGQTIKIIKPSKPVKLWVDAGKLQLVIDNLIHNAIKYSPPNRRITLALTRGRKHTTIEVRDQGIGIAPSDLHRLFKRFSRVLGPKTATIQGTGLGLYLAEKLVAMHGGTIDVRSSEGRGTTFTITLPNITKKEP